MLKTQAIQSQFRELPFERIAGVPDYVTIVNQQNFRYKIDLRTCYWNSRLDAEHQRVFDALRQRPDQFVLDGTGGVGPFALPLARRGLNVLTNDLNGACFRLVQENIRLNKLDDQRVWCANCDAIDLLRRFLVEKFRVPEGRVY